VFFLLKDALVQSDRVWKGERNQTRESMKAAILEGVNQPVVYQETADPKPSANEVIVRLAAAALNHRDVWIQMGRYAGLKFPIILGSDGAGEVSAVGADVDRRWLGQQVIINPGAEWGDNPRAQSRQFKILGLPDNGTFAQFVKTPAQSLVQKPDHLNFEAAAALPLAGVTAYRALCIRANLHDTDRILITGIGGGVALFALQFAVAAGAQVYVTSSSDEKIARAQELGAIGGANYKDVDWAKKLKAEVKGFDLIIDGAGGDGFAHLLDLAAPGGRVVVYGATQGLPKELDLRRVFWKQLNIIGSTMGTQGDFEAMVRYVQSRHIVPVVDQVFPLEETAGQQFGKVVLAIA
jgi:zinc-binding alcohol dehydrogenase/oxidoreductase